MQVTYQQALNAYAALQAYGKTQAPFATRLHVAKLLRVLSGIAQDFQTSRQLAYQGSATVDDHGDPVGVRTEQGQAIYQLSATDELIVTRAIESKLSESVEVDVEPMTLADFPAKLGHDDNAVTADILAALGPFLDLEGVE